MTYEIYKKSIEIGLTEAGYPEQDAIDLSEFYRGLYVDEERHADPVTIVQNILSKGRHQVLLGEDALEGYRKANGLPKRWNKIGGWVDVGLVAKPRGPQSGRVNMRELALAAAG